MRRPVLWLRLDRTAGPRPGSPRGPAEQGIPAISVDRMVRGDKRNGKLGHYARSRLQRDHSCHHPGIHPSVASPSVVGAMVSSGECEIRPVLRGDFPRVADLLRHLTHAASSWNRDYLTWKYLDNPFVERPLGIVAVVGREVVGFRGYYATPWQVPASSYEILVLSPGDTCVHPGHRRKGLSVEMGRAAMQELHPDYRIFLNMTAGASSAPGYLRMGFVPLHDKSRLTLTSFGRWARALPRLRGSPLAGVEFGEFGDIAVSPDPLHEEMGRVAMDPSSSEAKLTPLQDERFFRWYFRVPRMNHVFYYAREHGRVTGYVVLRVEEFGQRATIADYSRRSFAAVARILRFLARSRTFSLISIYSFTPNPELRRLLDQLGFRVDCAYERLRRRMNRVWPLFVRPVRVNPEDEDWFVERLDIREISSWEISEIRSDAI